MSLDVNGLNLAGTDNGGSRAVDGETIPIAGTRVKLFRRFGAMMGGPRTSDNGTSDDGYVEFGINDPERSTRTLGTFAGVFSPVALSMFSSLLFIRMGFLVGNAGLYVVLLQFLIAYLILVFTVTSVCAISTNGAVEGGGVYFMISRTLGPEFGGSIGTLFFLANVVGCALAISGCTEGIVDNLGPGGYYGGKLGIIPTGDWYTFLYCSVVNTLMLVVCLVGATLFAKTSVAILAIVVVCLLSTFVSFFIQGPMMVDLPHKNTLVNITTANYTGLSSTTTLKDNLFPHYGQDYTADGATVTFAIVFGVLFSGVTGIMAGANMSGELKNPSRNIPVGTLSATAFTFCVYIFISVFVAITSTGELLRNNFLFLMPTNVWPTFVAVGILTATFSTGLSNLIGSSRVLEALAKDKVYGSWLDIVTKGTWRQNPIAAIFISWFLVECFLLIGSLNVIAQINSILFLLAYFAVNLACLAIECTGAPNFRPTFKYFTWHTCVIGLMGTLIMMFVLNPIYASLSIIMCLILVIGLHFFSPTSQGTEWGSISQALMFHQVRKYLLMLDARKDHVKFWRPQILLLVASPRSCCPLIDFVNDLKKGGLYVLGHVKVGNYSEYEANDDPTSEECSDWISLVDHLKVKAFAEVTMSPTIRSGVQHLIRISGMGAMKPNTIIFGFYDEEVLRDFFESESSPYQTHQFSATNQIVFPMRRQSEAKTLSATDYVAIICDVLRMKKNVCLCRHFHRMDKQAVVRSNHVRYIDVWPVNVFDPSNEDPFDVVSMFMLQLSCIINMLPAWKKLHLRVFLCETDESSRTSSHFSVNSISQESSSEAKLKNLLNMLRIKASIHKISEWKNNEDFKQHSWVLRQFTSRGSLSNVSDYGNEEPTPSVLSDENINRSKMYMQKVNRIIGERSDATAATFIYLAAPPRINSPNWAQTSAQYLDLLTELTADLPPTVLVHGVSSVTSINL